MRIAIPLASIGFGVDAAGSARVVFPDMSEVMRVWFVGFRPWLVLGRVSNVPTVWSNCLAAWLLGGGGAAAHLALLLLGTTLIYVGGMMLNDAADARFDREFRRERPIPSGKVSEIDVWLISLLLLGAGLFLVSFLGEGAMRLGFLLVLAVIVYDLAHKGVPFAPWLMALCRYLLFLLAGAASRDGVTGEIMWCAFALGAYIVGLSYVARGEAFGWVPSWGPWLGLAVPVVLAGFMNPPVDWTSSQVAMPLVWYGLVVLASVTHLFRGGADGPKKAVSGLLAGIVAVDAVALMPTPWPWGAVFVALWGMTRVFQRSIPGT